LYTTDIKSRQPAVTSVVAEVESRLNATNLGSDLTGEICLILAEALNNVVKHAYSFTQDGDINIKVSLVDQWVTISIDDFGPEFSIPTTKVIPSPDPEDFGSLPEGGFGWSLIQLLTDKINLQRVNNRNHLELTKKIVCE